MQQCKHKSQEPRTDHWIRLGSAAAAAAAADGRGGACQRAVEIAVAVPNSTTRQRTFCHVMVMNHRSPVGIITTD